MTENPLPSPTPLKRKRRIILPMLGLAAMTALGIFAATRPRDRASHAVVATAAGPGPREAALRDGIRTNAGDLEAHLALVALLVGEGRRYDALDAAREASRALPDQPRVQEALANTLVATARLPEAIAALRKLPKHDPRVRVRLASVLVRDGRRAEAVALLDRLPIPSTQTSIEAGQVYLDALRPDAAVPHLRSAVAALPDNDDAQALLGLALILSGQANEATRVFEQVAERAPETAVIQFYLGSAIRLTDDVHRLPEAAEHLRRATELDPTAAVYFYELGLAHVQLRAWPSARTALEQAAALKADLSEVQRDLGRLYAREGEPARAAVARSRYLRLAGAAPQAVRDLEPAVRSHPGDLALSLELGEAYYDSWQTPKTLALLHKLEAADPKNETVLAAVFRGERAAGHHAKALASLDRLLKLTPDDAGLLDQRVDLLQRLARYSDLETLLTQLRDQEPENPARHFELGQALAQWSTRPDRMEAAEASFREVVRLQPNAAEAHYRLGLTLERTRRPEEAVRSFRRALDLSPKMTDALRALARGYTLIKDKERSAEAFRAYRYLNALDEEQRRLEMPSSLHRATPEERKRLADFYVRTGRFESAVSELEAVRYAHPEDREAQRLLAALFGHLRRFQRHFEERRGLADAREGSK